MDAHWARPDRIFWRFDMVRFRDVALSAALIFAAAATVGAQNPAPGARSDSAKMEQMRKRRAEMGDAKRPGEMGPRGMRDGPGGPGGPGFGPGGRRGFGPGMRRGFGPGGRGGPGMRRGGMRGDAMEFLRDLNLTDAQRTQVRTINEKYRTQFEAARDKTRTDFEAARAARQRGDTAAARAAFTKDRDAIKAQVEAVQNQRLNEIRAALTPDQRAKLDTRVAQRKQVMQEDRRFMEQQRKLMEEHRAKMEQLRKQFDSTKK
jgi:Spy/CpxP family protein refolding chaperone